MNILGGEFLYSNRDDLPAYNNNIISSQFIKVEPDRDISTVSPEGQIKFNLPTITNGSYQLNKAYVKGQIAINNVGFIASSTILALEQSLMCGLFRWDIRYGNTECKAHDCPSSVQMLSQAYFNILTNRRGKPYGTASLVFTEAPTLQGAFTYPAGAYPEGVQQAVVTSELNSNGTPFLGLRVDQPNECNFADLCLDTAYGASVQPLRTTELYDFRTGDFDSGYMYRIRLLKTTDQLTPSAAPLPVFTPVVNFIGHPPIPLMQNEHMFQGNIPLSIIATRHYDKYAYLGVGGCVITINKLDLYVRQCILSSNALVEIQSASEKFYHFHGFKSALFPLTNSNNININIDFASKTPSLVLFSFIRTADFTNTQNYPSGAFYTKSWLNWGLSSKLTASAVDASMSRRFLLTQGYLTLNGKNLPESDYLSDTNGAVQTDYGINTQIMGESDTYQTFKNALMDPSSIGKETAINNLGIYAIDCIANDGYNYWHNTQQQLTDAKPTLNLQYQQLDNGNVNIPITEYSVFVVVVTDRTMIVSGNQTVSFTSS